MVTTEKNDSSGKVKFKRSYSDIIFDIVNTIIMILLLFVFIYPLYFVLIASFSNPSLVYAGKVVWYPKEITLRSYELMLDTPMLWIGLRNNIFYTVVGTILNVFMTILCAYPLSQKNWMPRNFFTKMCMVTMYFGGGLIPTYLVVKNLGMVDTVWAMLIPSVLSFYNALIMRNYFMNSIPESLQEAAELDGANPLQYLVMVVLPLSKPSLAVIALYYAVGHWNDYYTALIYIFNEKLRPLQSVLREILFATNIMAQKANDSIGNVDIEQLAELMATSESLKYSTIIVSVVPMLIVYPFVQKYFVKGVMVGAIKG